MARGLFCSTYLYKNFEVNSTYLYKKMSMSSSTQRIFNTLYVVTWRFLDSILI